ncbi:MAG: hypothetical protein IT374_20545 [Polyangiaceae bacterium]|nr:hypothetical protein [Polyangiaceae bacterium]
MGKRATDQPPAGADDRAPRVELAKRALLEGVGAEVASSFPGITRLGGQIVAALYLAEGPQSMDQLTAELGCAKSNIFGNVRGLEAAGIVERRREAGARHDVFTLRGPYPDVIIGAYVARLRRLVYDKVALADRALALLGDERGRDADALRGRLTVLRRKYALFGRIFERVLPAMEGPIDLEDLLSRVPSGVFDALARLGRALPKRPTR